METEELYYEVTVYTENQVGLLSSIAGIFTRRSLNIDKLVVFPSEIPGVHKFSIRTHTTEEKMKQTVLQIEKKVDVIKAFYYEHPNNTQKEYEAVRKFLQGHEK